MLSTDPLAASRCRRMYVLVVGAQHAAPVLAHDVEERGRVTDQILGTWSGSWTEERSRPGFIVICSGEVKVASS